MVEDTIEVEAGGHVETIEMPVSSARKILDSLGTADVSDARLWVLLGHMERFIPDGAPDDWGAYVDGHGSGAMTKLSYIDEALDEYDEDSIDTLDELRTHLNTQELPSHAGSFIAVEDFHRGPYGVDDAIYCAVPSYEFDSMYEMIPDGFEMITKTDAGSGVYVYKT